MPTSLLIEGGRWILRGDLDFDLGKNIDLCSIVKEIPQGLCLEFGVAEGKSLVKLAHHIHYIYGFDSFKGLPHDWGVTDPRGAFRCKKPQVPDNCELIEGLFSDTLEGFLKVHRDPVGFVHIDCDLYNSTVYLLHCLMDRFVKGSLVAFDEIDQGPDHDEAMAWDRYLRETRQRWELLGKQHAWGRVYRYAGP